MQDLVGWDFSVLEYIISKQNIDLCCVGDFRQTIYQTSHATKKPQSSEQKRQWFTDKGFECLNLNHSWRCIDRICAFADMVHAHQGYDATTSNVTDIPDEFEDHVGIFAVSSDTVEAYLQRYNPVILRQNRSTREDICEGFNAQNFGEAKGLGFDRV